MDIQKLEALVLFLTREVGRLHATNAALLQVIQEVRIALPQLDGVDAAQIQVDAWQEWFEFLEKIDPGLAARLDDRHPRAFDTQASEDDRFPV